MSQIVGGSDFGRAHVCLGAIVYECFSDAVAWRLDEATNLPRFRPLDIGPVGFTGRSY